jgi:hypothetical protein
MKLLWALFLLSTTAWANQSSMTSSGRKLRWEIPQVPIMVQANTADLPATSIQAIVNQSMGEWNSTGAVSLQASSSSNNTISFLQDFSRYGSSVIGITEVSYTTSGTIHQAQIYLNDSFQFVTSPSATGSLQVFLGDVVTHELGHLLGLSHSEVLNSSMFYSNFQGQSTLGSDDKAAIRSKYASGLGKISGYMKGGKSVGVLGVHVQAFSRKTGESVGAVTNQDGFFEIDGLDLNDTYYLYSSPIKNEQSLPGYFSNTQTQFCPASYVGSFYQSCGKENEGLPSGINLTPTRHQAFLPTVTINCNLKVQDEYTYQKLQTTFAPMTVFEYEPSAPKYEQSFVGFFPTPTSDNWMKDETLKIDLGQFPTSQVSGKRLKLKLLSQAFGNLLEYDMRFERNGVEIPSARQTMSQTSVGTYSIDLLQDFALSTIPAENIFTVILRARRLPAVFVNRTYPSSSLFTTTKSLPHLIVASIESSSGPMIDTQSVLSDNNACLDAPFTYAVKGTSDSAEEKTSTSSDSSISSCGTIDPPKGGSGGASLALLAFGFIFVQLIPRTKKFLS